MGGGRSPCCDKSKVKKGPWSPAEDLKLVSFIQKHGHPNWRSLPNQAGLLRCGKSCRLRWINYLRPDVKRGNFTPDEETSIIRLHATFGNKWSKIASKLPGRTDNEIKNIWNTHLKKRSLITPMNNTSTPDSDFDKNQTSLSSVASSVSDDVGFTYQEKSTHNNIDHPKEAAGGVLIQQDIDQPLTPSSANSGQHHKLASCGCHATTTTTTNPSYLDKENLEIADLESDVEFWNMLEPELIINDHDMEVENWVRLLEDELGLEGPSVAASQHIDKNIDDEHKMNMRDEQDINSEIWCQISDEISPFWPTSPQNCGFC